MSSRKPTNDRSAVKLMERNNIDLVLAGVDPLDSKALELLTLRAEQASRDPCHPFVCRVSIPNGPRRRCGSERWPFSDTPFPL